MGRGFAHQVLKSDRSSRGRVFLGDVMALEDLTGVLVAEGSCRGAGDVEKQIYADGKIWSVDESGFVLFDQRPNMIDILVPARGADDHVLASFHAGFDVGENAVRRGEVDHAIDLSQRLRPQGGTLDVLAGAYRACVMSPVSGD